MHKFFLYASEMTEGISSNSVEGRKGVVAFQLTQLPVQPVVESRPYLTDHVPVAHRRSSPHTCIPSDLRAEGVGFSWSRACGRRCPHLPLRRGHIPICPVVTRLQHLVRDEDGQRQESKSQSRSLPCRTIALDGSCRPMAVGIRVKLSPKRHVIKAPNELGTCEDRWCRRCRWCASQLCTAGAVG